MTNTTTTARLSNNLSALASGSPRRMVRRARNVAVGRSLGRLGFWSWLYRGGRR